MVTQEKALKRAQSELGEFRDVFEGAVLPASIDVGSSRASAIRRR